LRVEPGTTPVEWNIFYGSNRLMVYSFDPTKFKPYVKELRTLKGQNLLRDAPHDHLHHHALMYGIRVNGVNFWEEIAGSGVEKPVRSPVPSLSTSADGQPQARITQLLHWVRPEDAFLPDTTPTALLIERRTLVLTVDAKEGEVALEWSSQFEVGHKTNAITLTGANYHGLGVRFRQDLDSIAVHSISGRFVDLSNNRQDLSPAGWGAVSFDVPGQAATFTMVGHPANVRGDAVFFSMKTPFAYLSATQALDKDPLVYRAGDTFTLRYLVLLYPDIRAADFLERRAQRWR
jgi:hypothetical protein